MLSGLPESREMSAKFKRYLFLPRFQETVIGIPVSDCHETSYNMLAGVCSSQPGHLSMFRANQLLRTGVSGV